MQLFSADAMKDQNDLQEKYQSVVEECNIATEEEALVDHNEAGWPDLSGDYPKHNTDSSGSLSMTSSPFKVFRKHQPSTMDQTGEKSSKEVSFSELTELANEVASQLVTQEAEQTANEKMNVDVPKNDEDNFPDLFQLHPPSQSFDGNFSFLSDAVENLFGTVSSDSSSRSNSPSFEANDPVQTEIFQNKIKRE